MQSDAAGDVEAAAEARSQEDASIVARILAGEAEAFGELLDRYQSRVFRLVSRMFSRQRETAEDLTQEVFLRVYRGLSSFQGDCSFYAWVHRIACNLCVSEIRKKRALKRDRTTVSLQGFSGDDGEDRTLEVPSPERGPAEAVERAELSQSCREVIEAMPELWRTILVLRDIEEKSYEEIAEILDLPIGTVRSRLHRARARVRDALEGGAA